MTKPKILPSLFFLGFVSIISQTALIRELLVLFSGNELTIGIMIANWVFIMALGNYLTGVISDKAKLGIPAFVAFEVALLFYLPASVLIARALKNCFLVFGLVETFYISFLIFLPAAFLLGGMFSLGCKIYDEERNFSGATLSDCYICDSLGDLLGGVLLTYFLIQRMDPVGISLLLGALLLVSGIFLTKFNRTLIILLAVVLMALGGNFGNKINVNSIARQWKGFNVLSYVNSPYHNITTAEKDNQTIIFVNGVPSVTYPVPDIAAVEENAHFPMLFHKMPASVLLAGGNPETVGELLKYPVRKITYAETDPEMIRAENKITNDLKNPKVFPVYTDARAYLENTPEKFDVILINVSYPLTLEANRYYTEDFFRKACGKLAQGGILCLSQPGSLAYMNPELKNLNSCIYSSLKPVFRSVRVLPFDSSNMFLASMEDLGDIGPDEIISRLKKYGLKLKFVSEAYIKYRMDQKWAVFLLDSIQSAKDVRINRDFLPAGAFYAVSLWAGMFSKHTADILGILNKATTSRVATVIFLIAAALFIAAQFFKQKSTRFAITSVLFTTGFSGMGFTMLLIFSYQIFYGNLYKMLGLLLALFMFGLSVGALAAKIALKRNCGASALLAASGTALIIFTLLLPSAVMKLSRVEFIFPSLLFLSGIITGSAYPPALEFFPHAPAARIAGFLYSMDLLGAFFSAILVSVWFLPVYGFETTCHIMVLMQVLSAAFLLTRIFGREKA